MCSCCTQTFFRHFVRRIDKISDSKRSYFEKFNSNHLSFDKQIYCCLTCLESACKGKTPKLWIKNGLKFPNQPVELQLTNLEERLVSPRIPFMQLRQMPRGGQISLKGNVVNVPSDVSGTIKLLPRMIDENETIMLKLKRRLSYKHHVAFENIRPNKVFQAARWLVANSTLFQNEGISVNETWLHESRTGLDANDSGLQDDAENQNESDDGWTEDDGFADRLTGNLDTFLQAADFREFNQVLSVAPGENSSPLGLFQDFQSEILSFPTIFCGQPRVDNSDRHVPLHYSDICKWELRNVDRRVALCVPNIFFKLKRLQIKQVRDKVLLAVRKCKSNTEKITVADLLTPGFIEKLTMQDDGYRVLRTLRGSPPYWEAAKKDVFAMIRQLGIPTWFCSFSAAETKWKPLLNSLSKLLNGKSLTSLQIDNLSWEEKCNLIKSDPVTCARYFQHRVNVFIKHVLKHVSHPIGQLSDYFYRVEFQQRGSPHIHMVAWVNGAPLHGTSSDEAIVSFVEKYICCSKDDSISEYVNYQTHRHAPTCRKRGQAICRFNFPIPPMAETKVLYPLERDFDRSYLNDVYSQIIDFLNNLHKDDNRDISFKDFLSQLDIDYETYILAIRSSLSQTKVFLKRNVNECRINNYNKVLLKSWKANMDIQYILDPYSCVSYIVSYISKGQRGLSNLLQAACQEASDMDSDIRQRVRRIGNTFLSSVEIGAQEAVYLALQMPLRHCTRDVIFVDTNRPEKRTSLIKPLSELKDLPSSSCNIEMDNTLKRYVRRPTNIKNICYADFASWYDLCKRPKKEKVNTEKELPEEEYELNQDDYMENENNCNEIESKIIEFCCGTVMRKRKSQKVIYWHYTPLNNDREEHFRERIMLFTCWRNENDFLDGYETFEESYNAKIHAINENKTSYEKNDNAFYEHLNLNIDTDDLVPIINSEANHQDHIDQDEGTSPPVDFGCFDPGCDPSNEYDLGDDLGISRKQISNEILPHKEMEQGQFLNNIQALNVEQKMFFNHIVHKVKSKAIPFYTYLSGGAGCGKTVVVKTIFQALLKYFNHQRGQDPSLLKVLMCAPTGKAAHNIGGYTIHSAFCIPVSQGFKFKPLDMQQLNTMRARYQELKVIIVDEISMVGRGMFNFINLRLQEVKGCTLPFGGVSILAVGDMYQLRPVSDSWIFSQKFSSPDMRCLGTNLWHDLFDFFELTEIMRQRHDLAFAELLNRLRTKQHTKEDLALLRSRKLNNLPCTSSIDVLHLPHLFAAKVDMYSHNKNILSKIPLSDKVSVEAIDSVSGNVNPSLMTKILSKVPLDPSKTMGLYKTLVLSVGLPVEVSLNIDTEDGLTNGAPAVVKKFDFRVPSSSRCSIIWVEFLSPDIGKKWRLKYKHLYNNLISNTWTPILETCRKFTFMYYKSYLIVRRQFPLYLSSGKTIHKAQGSTLKEAVLHFGKKKIDHIHYVGLSRVTQLSNVYIMELNEDKISVCADTDMEMSRLRTHMKIKNCIPDLSQYGESLRTVCFQNCRTLRKHIQNIKNERNLLAADVIGFVETKLQSPLSEDYDIDGFYNLSFSFEEASHGIAVYIKNSLKFDKCLCYTRFSIECALLCCKDTVLGFVYCPPGCATVSNISQFLLSLLDAITSIFHLTQQNIILMGDFNYDYEDNKRIARLFQETLGCVQLINVVTTDYNSCLDHIYVTSNISVVESGTLESCYSDHKPIFVVYESYC